MWSLQNNNHKDILLEKLQPGSDLHREIVKILIIISSTQTFSSWFTKLVYFKGPTIPIERDFKKINV